MKMASAIMAVVAGIMTLLVGVLETALTHPHDSPFINAAVGAALVGSAVFSMLGRLVWLLPATWAVLTAGFVVLIAVEAPSMDIMHGGLFIGAMFGYLLTGLGLSLGGVRTRHLLR